MQSVSPPALYTPPVTRAGGLISTSRKRSVSNVSAENDSIVSHRRDKTFHSTRIATPNPSTPDSHSKRFRSIATPIIDECHEPIPPPVTPCKSLEECTLPGSLPLSTDILHCSIPLSLRYHDTSLVCSEGGWVSFHKGITPGEAKGYYCCQNAELASRETSLRVVDNSVLFEVYGPRGLLAYVEAADSAFIRQEVVELEAAGNTAVVCAHNFLNSRQCVRVARTTGYTFTEDSWKAVISIYARPTSATFCTMPPSVGAAMTHASFASSPTINHMNCVFPVHPTPLRQNLFGGSAVGAAAVRSCSFPNSNSTHFGHSMRPYCPKGPLEPMNLCRTQMF